MTLRSRVIGLVAAAVLVGIGTAPTLVFAQDAQDPAVTVSVENPDGRLSDSDTGRLVERAGALEYPEVVDEVTYLVFDDYSGGQDYDSVFNDAVEQYARARRPDLIDGEFFADGNLIVGVGYNPNFNGVYCGNDVCDELDLWEGQHLDRSLEAARDDLRNDNIVSGLLATTEVALDPTAGSGGSGDGSGAIVGGILGGVGVVAAAAGGTYAMRNRNKRRANEARDNYAFVMAHYGSVAGRLDAIDVRAHSLTSPLANAKLRKEWEEVRDKFLSLHDEVQDFDTITTDSDDKAYRSKYDALKQAAQTTRQVATAEENIDAIYAVEHGDRPARMQAADDLYRDMLKAQTVAKSDVLQKQARELGDRAFALRDDADADDFLDQYVQLLSDCSTVVGLIDEQEFSDVKRTTEREEPRLYDSNYRVGTGVYNYVPFGMVYSWHQRDVETHEAAQSSSSTNTSFSSGFSGGGGSGRF